MHVLKVRTDVVHHSFLRSSWVYERYRRWLLLCCSFFFFGNFVRTVSLSPSLSGEGGGGGERKEGGANINIDDWTYLHCNRSRERHSSLFHIQK
jgi:hypothetical protein